LLCSSLQPLLAFLSLPLEFYKFCPFGQDLIFALHHFVLVEKGAILWPWVVVLKDAPWALILMALAFKISRS